MRSGDRAEKLERENRIVNKGKEKLKKRSLKSDEDAKIIPFGKPGRKDIPDMEMENVSKKASRPSQKKTPKQAQEHIRFITVIGMAGCMALIMLICIILSIKDMGSTHAVPAGAVEEPAAEDTATEKTVDMEALAKKVLDNVAFEVALEKLDDSVAEGMVKTTDGTKLQIYMGNGTNADELVLMTASSEKDAETDQEYVEEHLNEIKKQFELYIPEQVKKIENAVKIRSGCYVVVCITSDTETAKRTIESFIK